MKTQEENNKTLIHDMTVFTPNGSLTTYTQYLNWDKD